MAELRVKSTGTLKLFESDNTSSVTIASPASLGADRTVTLPDGDVTLVAGTMSTGFAVTDITGQTALGATPADTDEFVLTDAGVLKRVDYSYIKGEENKPYFWAYAYATQSGVSSNTWTVVNFPSEYYDSGGAYDTTTMKFTPQKAGIYHIGGMANSIPDAAVTQFMVALNKNAAADPIYAPYLALGSANLSRWQGGISGLMHFNGSTDYVQMMVRISGQDGYIMGHNGYTNFWGYYVGN